MRKTVTYGIWVLLALGIVVAGFAVFRKPYARSEDILAAYEQAGASHGGLTVLYPLDETMFPPEIVSPTFRWKDSNPESNLWLVTIQFRDDAGRINALTNVAEWTPPDEQWQTIKQRSRERKATVTILGIDRRRPQEILSAEKVSISTSQDEVGAPLFYREVNLPFVEAVKDPSRIRWRFGAISSKRPPVVLEKLPVCGNCHSFSAQAKTLAMDVDYANNRGSYVITQVAEKMTLATSDIITWDDYKKDDGEPTFGLLSQISPDGKFVVSTVKDLSVFVPTEGLAFSQLFFPVKGILCIYNRETKTFQALPGADDPQYVQSNPVWSPDGKTIVFARAKALELKHVRDKEKVLLTRDECSEFVKDGKPFRFDLFRIPFNDGKGGQPEPIEGASDNGLSNFFPRYSPDGKWIVFCKAKNYMLLQPDSELHIIPAEGGEARRLRCNTHLMNSWHSWSPNGRWLVFSSKANSVYTQLFLTHIDEEGRSTPAVSLSHLTDPQRAANIPEFVNTQPSAIKKISEDFLDDLSYVRAGYQLYKAGDLDAAIEEFRTALTLNPDNFEANLRLCLLYSIKKMHEEGRASYERVKALCASDPLGAYRVGRAMVGQEHYAEADFCLSFALREIPHEVYDKSTLTDIHHNLGVALLYVNRFEESLAHMAEAVRLDPNNAQYHYDLALVFLCLGKEGRLKESLDHYSKAVSLDPKIDRSPRLHHLLAVRYAQTGRFAEAVSSAELALKFARASGDRELTSTIKRELDSYRKNQQPSHPEHLPQ